MKQGLRESGVPERAPKRCAARLACAAFCAILVNFSAAAAIQTNSEERHHDVSIATLVKALGSDDKDLDRIKALATQPLASAGLLIAELHPVKGVRILSNDPRAPWKDTLHVIWCLRALRYITGGLEFRGRTDHVFGAGEIEQRRKWFVGGEEFDKDRTVRFFGVWMSRDSTYIAPRDAQIEIIRQWSDWYEQHGRTFAYANPAQSQPPDVYYF